MRVRHLAPILLAACAGSGDPDDKAPGQWTPGKGDGAYDLVEAGPAPVGGHADITFDHRVPAYRVESYGGTKLTVELSGREADAYLVVEGPLAGDGDKVAVGGGTVLAEDDDSGPGRDAKLEL